VLGFVGSEGQGTSIHDEEIESLRTALREKIPCLLHPFVKTGRRVRIRGGCLDGIEGILERQGADQSLVVSVELLRRSVSIRVGGYEIELI
jgi:transcription antitermination factor NusG